MITVKCDNCKKKIFRKKWHVLHRKNNFCSQKCHYAFCTENSKGHIKKNGYRYISIKGKQYAEHRLVIEGQLGRKLHKGETVHHINGQRADNRLENLELRMRGNHPVGWSLRQMREYLKTVPKKLGGLK